MIKQLLSLQFVFMFCPAYIIALTVYGSDFKGVTGWIYTGALLVILVLHAVKRFWMTAFSEPVIRGVLLTGVALGVAGYRQIHFMAWDEHSIKQAILIGLLGLFSYVAAMFATTATVVSQSPQARHPGTHGLFKILLLLALFWLPAVVYPHFAMLAVLLLMGLGAIYLSWPEPRVVGAARQTEGWEFQYWIFLLLLDGVLVVWDYKVNSQWAFYLSSSFLAAALGAFAAPYIPQRWRPGLYMLVILNLCTAVLVPVYVVSTLHSVVVGFGLGVSLGWSFTREVEGFDYRIASLWPLVLLALILSNGLYVHLSLAQWRLVFVIPILVTGIRTLIKPRIVVQSNQ